MARGDDASSSKNLWQGLVLLRDGDSESQPPSMVDSKANVILPAARLPTPAGLFDPWARDCLLFERRRLQKEEADPDTSGQVTTGRW